MKTWNDYKDLVKAAGSNSGEIKNLTFRLPQDREPFSFSNPCFKTITIIRTIPTSKKTPFRKFLESADGLDLCEESCERKTRNTNYKNAKKS